MDFALKMMLKLMRTKRMIYKTTKMFREKRDQTNIYIYIYIYIDIDINITNQVKVRKQRKTKLQQSWNWTWYWGTHLKSNHGTASPISFVPTKKDSPVTDEQMWETISGYYSTLYFSFS